MNSVNAEKKSMSIYSYLRKEWKFNVVVLCLMIIGQACLILWGVNVSDLVTYLANHNIDLAIGSIITLACILLLWSVQIVRRNECKKH